MLVTRYIPCTLYKKLVYPLLLLSALLLALLFVPGLGRKVGGAYRWMNLGGFSFQPSEMVKFSLAVYLAYSMSKKGADLELFTKGPAAPHIDCRYVHGAHLPTAGSRNRGHYRRLVAGTAVCGGRQDSTTFFPIFTGGTHFHISGLERRIPDEKVVGLHEPLG